MNISERDPKKLAEKYWAAPILLAIFLIAVGLRYHPARTIEYLSAMDPYNLFRSSQQIAYTGGLPELDFMRYFPYAYPLHLDHMGNLVIPAILYWAGGFLIFDSFLEFGYWIQPLFSGFAAIAMYYLGKEMFDKYTGLGAAFFIAVIPGAMFRSSAGFFEKEAIGTFFMIVSLLFFVRAWKRKDWINGIFAGLALGIFTTTWGGSGMLWLLYPMTVGFMLLIDKDIENLVAAFTPTVLMAVFFASIFNSGRFWFDHMYVYLNAGMLALLWTRFLVEELNLLKEDYLPYFSPSMYITGGLALALSPLYSSFLADITFSIYRRATQTDGGTISGTVAEDAAPGLGELTTQLGTGIIDQIFPGAEIISALVGPWTLVFLAVPLMIVSAILMLAKSYGVLEDTLEGKKYYGLIAGVISAWGIAFLGFFGGYTTGGIALGLIMLLLVSVLVFYIDGESVLSITTMSLLFTAIIATLFSFGQQDQASVLRGAAYPLWLGVFGFGLIYFLEDFKPRQINIEWYQFLGIFWIITNLLGATARNRLIFLAAFPVAFGAGYTVSIAYRRIKSLDLDEIGVSGDKLRPVILIAGVAMLLSVNIFAGWVTVQGIGGQPNEAWMENLDYLREDAEEGSVVLSWWDYGYHFQSLGRSASVADGGNYRYYTSDERVNFPIARYFTSDDPDDDQDLLEKHSVDYVVLDNTMIGKYGAVSQIAREDNQNFDSWSQAETMGGIDDVITSDGDSEVVPFIGSIEGLPAEIFAPVNRTEQSVELSDSATIQTMDGQRMSASCLITDEGVQEFGDGDSEYCIAEDPYFNLDRSQVFGQQARLVIVPRDIKETNIARMYLMDGHGIDYLEKVEDASNDFIKTWRVNE